MLTLRLHEELPCSNGHLWFSRGPLWVHFLFQVLRELGYIFFCPSEGGKFREEAEGRRGLQVDNYLGGISLWRMNGNVVGNIREQ